jgi:hypothetical protein
VKRTNRCRGAQMCDSLEGLSDVGTIRTGADIGRVAEAFRPVHRAALAMIRERECSASVYACGSVVTGQAGAGVSERPGRAALAHRRESGGRGCALGSVSRFP